MAHLENKSLRAIFETQDFNAVSKTWALCLAVTKAQPGVLRDLSEAQHIMVVTLLTTAILAIGGSQENAKLSDVDAFLFGQDRSYKETAGALRSIPVKSSAIANFIRASANQLANLTDRARDPIFMALNAILHDLRLTTTPSSSFQNGAH